MDRSVYVIGDIHGEFNILEARFGDEKTSFIPEKKDVLFVAGDAGFINPYENSESKQKRILSPPKKSPRLGIEPRTLRLTAECTADCATQAYV